MDSHPLSPINLPFTAPPADFRASDGEVHVWCLDRRDFANDLPKLSALLSSAELERATRFHFADHREFYTIRRGILRIILARYLKRDPDELEFSYGARGKPELPGAALHFNDSHSGDFALLAVTAACPLGVDIENARPIPDFENIAENYFSPREVAMMRALSSESRMHAFYTAWTRKEAFLKATGEGIGESLAKVEVTLAPDDEPAILALPGDPQAWAEWKLKAFSPAPGYLAALAFRHADLKLRLWNVSPLEL